MSRRRSSVRFRQAAPPSTCEFAFALGRRQVPLMLPVPRRVSDRHARGGTILFSGYRTAVLVLSRLTATCSGAARGQCV
jgi:hypothetical protein